MATNIKVDLKTGRLVPIADDTSEVTFDLMKAKVRLIEEEVVVAAGTYRGLLLLGVGV